MPGNKPKPPRKPVSSPPAKPAQEQTPPNSLIQADNRWQRTVRYGWDKGGAKGGRR